MKKIIAFIIIITIFFFFSPASKVEAKTKYIKVKATTVKTYKKALKENKKLKKENDYLKNKNNELKTKVKKLIRNFLDYGYWEWKDYYIPEANYCIHCHECFANKAKGEVYRYCPNCGQLYD